MKYKLALIEWLDHHSGGAGWEPLADAKQLDLVLCRTIGWIIFEDKRRVVIAATFGSGGDVADHMAVSKRDIVRRYYLKSPLKRG